MHHRIKMSYLEPILVHPVRRQNFAGKSDSTFWNIWDWVISSISVSFCNPMGGRLWNFPKNVVLLLLKIVLKEKYLMKMLAGKNYSSYLIITLTFTPIKRHPLCQSAEMSLGGSRGWNGQTMRRDECGTPPPQHHFLKGLTNRTTDGGPRIFGGKIRSL